MRSWMISARTRLGNVVGQASRLPLKIGHFLPVSRSETTMVAVGLSPRTAAKQTIGRRRATPERSNNLCWIGLSIEGSEQLLSRGAPARRGREFRLGRFPFGFADFFDFVHKCEGPFFVPDNDVRLFVTGEVARHDLGADAGIVVNQVRNEIHGLVLVTNQLEPVENRGRVWVGIAMRAVGPIAFAGYDVVQAVPVG